MASYATTSVATSEVIKAMDTRIDELHTRIDELQKLLASLKRDRKRMATRLEEEIAVSQRRRLQMIRDDDDNYTLTVSRDELDLILAQLQIASACSDQKIGEVQGASVMLTNGDGKGVASISIICSVYPR